MAGIHVQLSDIQSLGTLDTSFRARLLSGESLLGGVPTIRVRLSTVESAIGGVPNQRTRLLALEAAGGSTLRNLRVRVLIIEALQAVLEPDMSDAVFPTMIGLAWDVSKKPIFSNKIALHTSGKETATSYYQNPKWEYTLTYDYLPDLPVSVGNTDLHTLLGFFLSRRGRFDTFLFSDPDDNTVVDGFQKDFDGSSVDFNLVRSIGDFYEPVGQLNTGLSVYLALTETSAIPGVGPYTITVAHAAAYHSTLSVTINGVAATVGTAAGQYTVAAGVYTFNSADHGKTAVIRYLYLVDPADYTMVMPNIVQFDVAPANGSSAYASFTYYFRCRFIDDASEYTNFAKKLWNLQELGFRSIPSS